MITQLCRNLGIFVAAKAHPVSREGDGEFVQQRFAGSEFEAFVGDPIAVAANVYFYYDRSSFIGLEREGFLIVARHQVGIGIFVRFDAGIFPRTTFAHCFAQFPGIVDGASPHGGFAVIGADDVFVIGSFRANATEKEKSVP